VTVEQVLSWSLGTRIPVHRGGPRLGGQQKLVCGRETRGTSEGNGLREQVELFA